MSLVKQFINPHIIQSLFEDCVAETNEQERIDFIQAIGHLTSPYFVALQTYPDAAEWVGCLFLNKKQHYLYIRPKHRGHGWDAYLLQYAADVFNKTHDDGGCDV